MRTEQREITSWSEIRKWITCRMQWYWSYVVKIVPRRIRRPLFFGSLGHLALCEYYKGNEKWRDKVHEHVKKNYLEKQVLFEEDIENYNQTVSEVIHVVERYINFYKDNFEIISLEKKFEIPIKGLKIKLIGYWDMIVKDDTDKLWLWENKFPVRAMQTFEDIILNGQLGSYHWAALRTGHDVVGLMYNQLLAKLPTLPS